MFSCEVKEGSPSGLPLHFKRPKNKFGLWYKLLYICCPKGKNDHETNCPNLIFSSADPVAFRTNYG